MRKLTAILLIFIRRDLDLVCVMTSIESSDTHGPWSYFGSYVLDAVNE